MSPGERLLCWPPKSGQAGLRRGWLGEEAEKGLLGWGVREEWVGSCPALPASLTQCHAVEGDASQRHAGEEPEGTVDGEVGSEGGAGS